MPPSEAAKVRSRADHTVPLGTRDPLARLLLPCASCDVNGENGEGITANTIRSRHLGIAAEEPTQCDGVFEERHVTPPGARTSRLRGIVLADDFGLGRDSAFQLANNAGAHLPTAALAGLVAGSVLGLVLTAAQLAFDLGVVALLQLLCIFGGGTETDNAVPLGVGDPIAGLLVLVAGLGGE